jgi:hypothetical protein
MVFLDGNANITGGQINNTIIGNNLPDSGTFTILTADTLKLNDLIGDHQYTFVVNDLSSNINVELPLLLASDTFVFEDHSQALTNKTIVDISNVVTANNLRTLGSDVNISTSSPPVLDQVLQATNATTAVWKHLPVRNSVKVATTMSGNLANDFENGDTIDGVNLITGDRLLITDQATSSENGIYIVQATGAPIRAADYNTGQMVASSFFVVQQGMINADSLFLCTNNTGSDVVGVDSLMFSKFTGGSISKVAYTLTTFRIDATKNTYTTAAYFMWKNMLYSSYANGQILLRVIINNRNLDIRLRDVTNSVDLFNTTISMSGFYCLPIANGTTDAQIELQIRKTSGGGVSPQILYSSLEFDN